MPAQTQFLLRRGYSNSFPTQSIPSGQSRWIDVDSPNGPVLLEGEIGFEIDTGRFKIGNGISTWSSLNYSALVPSGLSGASGISVSLGPNGSGATISVTGLSATQITDFNSAVDARVTQASISSQEVMNIVNSGMVGGTGISLSYTPGALTINTTGVSLNGHSHSWSDITNASNTVSLTELAYLSGVTPGSASANKALVVNANRNIVDIGSISTTGDVTVGGNLFVAGSSTTVNSTVVDIGDNIIRVNTSGLPTGGFEVYNATGVKQLLWNNNSNRWELSGGASLYTSGLVIANGSQLTNLDFANISSNIPSPIITGILTGDVSGVASVTLSALNNAVLSINASIAPDSVNLGTHTVGDYVQSVTTAGIGLSASGVGEGAAITITSNATPSNVTGTLVSRDSSGGFSAGLVAATGFSGDGSQITNLNSANISNAINVTQLSASGLTLGSTTINLGQTVSVIDGLTRISGTSPNSPVYIINALIDGGTP